MKVNPQGPNAISVQNKSDGLTTQGSTKKVRQNRITNHRDGGAEFIGETIKAYVLSVKHTSSGRMIFCNAAEEDASSFSQQEDTSFYKSNEEQEDNKNQTSSF